MHTEQAFSCGVICMFLCGHCDLQDLPSDPKSDWCMSGAIVIILTVAT